MTYFKLKEMSENGKNKFSEISENKKIKFQEFSENGRNNSEMSENLGEQVITYL